MKTNRLVGIFAIFLILFTLAIISPLLSQDEQIITVYVPSWIRDTFNKNLLDKFYADHPGVKVVLIEGDDDDYISPAAFGVEEHLNGFEDYAQLADIVHVTSWNFSVESTRAGYFLNLDPLIQGDASFDTSDFIPSALQSFQWDRGTWGLPIVASVNLLVYDKAAFDDAGLSYPSENWTLHDMINTSLALTTYNEDGSIDTPGFAGYSPALLFRSLTGEGFYDASQLPNTPSFTHPDLPEYLQTWSDFITEMNSASDYDYNRVPLAIEQTWRLQNAASGSSDGGEWAASLLPGGTAGISVEGFAISAGTQHPEIAYEFLKFLTEQPEMSQRFFGDRPARYSLFDVDPEDSTFFRPELSDDVKAIIDNGLENGISAAELRFGDYLNLAMSTISESGDATEALEEAEQSALDALAAADSRRDTVTVMVPTPVPTPVIGQNQIVMKFGLNLFTSEITNRDRWDELVADFLAQNPDVGNINLIGQFFDEESFLSLDCFYQPYNAIQGSNVDLSTYLNLDPFMDADPSFDRSDFLTGVLEQVQRENRTWGYPIVIQPEVLWYDNARFQEANLVSPEGGWTVEAFDEAVKMLPDYSDTPNTPAFTPESFGNSYILLLTAAYGGLPYDIRTDPPTFNLTDPTTADALRQVLDLAKEGYIDYQELGGNGGSFGGGRISPPILTDTFTSFSWRLQNRDQENGFEGASEMLLTNYPRGSQYTPLAYSVGAAYIHATAQNPEACYRWISMISQHPELFSGVPARTSMVNSPDVATTQGEDIAALYQEFAQLMDDQNLITLPTSFAGVPSSTLGAWLEPTWMNIAFDNYVLKEGDLESELQLAEENIQTYRDCTSQIPIIDTATFGDDVDAAMDYFRQYVDCAVAITPELREQYSYYYQEDNN